MKGIFRLLGLIFGAVAVVLLVIAGIFFGTTHHTLAGYDRTSGTVVAVNTTGGAVTEPGAYEGQPVVEYVVAGHTYRWVDPVSSHPVSHDVGSTVTIAYDPGAPQKAKLPGPSSYLVSIVTGSIGAVFLIVAGVLLLVGFIVGRRQASFGTSASPQQGAMFQTQTQAPAVRSATYAAGVDAVTDNPGSYPTVRISWSDGAGGSGSLEATGPEAVGLVPGDQVWVRTGVGAFGMAEILREAPTTQTAADHAPLEDAAGQPPHRETGSGGGTPEGSGELPSVIQEL